MSVVETPPNSAALDTASAKKIGYTLAAVGSITPILILFVSQPALEVLALLSILLQLMLLGLVLAMPLAFMISPPRLNGRMINYALIIPVLCMALAGADGHLVEPRITVVIALILGLAAMLGALLAPRSGPIPSPIFYAVFVAAFAGGFGWGATTLANRAFDLSEGLPYQAQVEFKYQTYGRNNGYHLTLAPWGPITQPTSIGVSGALYVEVAERSPICIRLHPGALGLGWYTVGVC